LAQQPLPSVVQQAIDEAKRDCDSGRVVMQPRFVTAKDVNGDGRPDYILDYEHYVCDGNAALYCGSAGCLTQIFASLPDGSYVKVLDQNVQALEFVRRRKRPAMILHLHGSECGKVGTAPCRSVLYWNGSSFSPAH